LTVLAIVVPLALTTERTVLRGSAPLFFFFAGIGLGFMLVEISQMQRLIIFLGHPTYSLSVVLFALLVSSGIGSYVTDKVRSRGGILPFLLLGVLGLFGAVSGSAIGASQTLPTPVRILVAGGMLFPLGLLMGTLFPLGMRLASARSPALTPWLWGVNGATSVCASVLAVVIALSWSISTAFWTGVACYAMASVTFAWAAAGTMDDALVPGRGRGRVGLPSGGAERPGRPGRHFDEEA
jgi:predicted membrane-bound spermidine synthase